MLLTGELYRQIATQLTGNGRVDPRTSRRTEPRVGLRAIATILCETCDDRGLRALPAKVYVTDISWGGIGFTARTEIRRGEKFLLHLPCHARTDLLVRYVAMHIMPVDQGRLWSIGGKAIALCDAYAGTEHAFGPHDDRGEFAHRISDQMRAILEQLDAPRRAV